MALEKKKNYQVSTKNEINQGTEIKGESIDL